MTGLRTLLPKLTGSAEPVLDLKLETKDPVFFMNHFIVSLSNSMKLSKWTVTFFIFLLLQIFHWTSHFNFQYRTVNSTDCQLSSTKTVDLHVSSAKSLSSLLIMLSKLERRVKKGQYEFDVDCKFRISNFEW